jgi:hypothetical protein
MGYKAGILQHLRASTELNSDFADILFSGAQPSLTTFSEREAFRHYLHCLHEQTAQSRRNTFKETIDAHSLLLEIAEVNLRDLHRYGVRGQHRDYENIIDVNRAALSGLETARGFVLNRQWS